MLTYIILLLMNRGGMNVHYHVKLDQFEGPLDLLLHLIHRYEIDIYDIPVAQITDQYMAYIHAMKELQLDVASEYLVMAATLIEMKSKMLLPKHEETLEDQELFIEEDPREQLMQQLIEYKKFKEAAKQLREREEERALLFTKPPSDLTAYAANGAPLALDVDLYDMLGALAKLLRRKKLQKPLHTKVARQEIPIGRRMEEILHILKHGERMNFYDLFPYDDREQIVVTFLALLELMKRNEIIVEQENNFADLYIRRKGDRYE